VVASCPFCSCRVESEGFQGPGGVPGVVPAGGGDTGVPGRFQDSDGQVAQGGHGLGSAAGADLGGVFAVADVADVVQASICQWPRIQSASWAGAAWWASRLVMA